jgi:hypothetical protein
LYEVPSQDSNATIQTTVAYPSSALTGMAQLHLTRDGSYHFYVGDQTNGHVIEFNPNTGAPIGVVASVTKATGLLPFPDAQCVSKANPPPRCNHLLVTNDDGGMWEIDPVAKTSSQFISASALPSPDGVAWSVDGSVLYAVSRTNSTGGTGTVLTFDTNGNAIPNAIGQFGIGLDGVAIGTGILDGCIYVNDNGGNVWQVELPTSTGTPCSRFQILAAPSITTIAQNGSRGDHIAVDSVGNSGATDAGYFATLLVTQTDSVYRIDPPLGGFFGPPSSTLTPPAGVSSVPATGGAAGLLGLSFGLVVVGAVVVTRRRRGAVGSNSTH